MSPMGTKLKHGCFFEWVLRKLRIANIGLDIDSEKHSEDLLEYGICIQDHSRHAIVLQHVTSLPSTFSNVMYL
jgi:hypothetical protein